MQCRVEVGEGGRAEVVDVLGELGLEELVAHHRRDPGIEQDPGRGGRRPPQQRQWPGALLIDVEREQGADPAPDDLSGLGPGPRRSIADLLRRPVAEPLDEHPLHTSFHPGSQCPVDAVGQRGGVLLEALQVIG